MRHPVLQLHQFLLQAQKLLEIGVAVERVLDIDIGDVLQKLRQPRVVDLQFQLFVEHIRHFRVEPFLGREILRLLGVHVSALLEIVGPGFGPGFRLGFGLGFGRGRGIQGNVPVPT